MQSIKASKTEELREVLRTDLFMVISDFISEFKDCWQRCKLSLLHHACPSHCHPEGFLQMAADVLLAALFQPPVQTQPQPSPPNDIHASSAGAGPRKSNSIQTKKSKAHAPVVKKDARSLDPSPWDFASLWVLETMEGRNAVWNLAVVFALYALHGTQPGPATLVRSSSSSSSSSSCSSSSGFDKTKAKPVQVAFNKYPIRVSVLALSSLLLAADHWVAHLSKQYSNDPLLILGRMWTLGSFKCSLYSGPGNSPFSIKRFITDARDGLQRVETEGPWLTAQEQSPPDKNGNHHGNLEASEDWVRREMNSESTAASEEGGVIDQDVPKPPDMFPPLAFPLPLSLINLRMLRLKQGVNSKALKVEDIFQFSQISKARVSQEPQERPEQHESTSNVNVEDELTQVGLEDSEQKQMKPMTAPYLHKSSATDGMAAPVNSSTSIIDTDSGNAGATDVAAIANGKNNSKSRIWSVSGRSAIYMGLLATAATSTSSAPRVSATHSRTTTDTISSNRILTNTSAKLQEMAQKDEKNDNTKSHDGGIIDAYPEEESFRVRADSPVGIPPVLKRADVVKSAGKRPHLRAQALASSALENTRVLASKGETERGEGPSEHDSSTSDWDFLAEQLQEVTPQSAEVPVRKKTRRK